MGVSRLLTCSFVLRPSKRPKLAFALKSRGWEELLRAAGRRWPAAGYRVAGAVHRASWRSCCARGHHWPAAGCRVAGAVHRASAWSPLARGWPQHWLCGRRSTQSLLEELVAAGLRLAVVWQAQYTEPPGGAAARVVAAGPRLAVVWQAQYTELLAAV